MPRKYPQRGDNYNILERQVKEMPAFASGLPNTLIIEPGAVCSLECPFCPQSSRNFDFSRELLPLEGFRRIIDYFEEVVDTVMLFNWGEPLLNPELVEMIRYASERQMYTVVHSNLNNLDGGLAGKLVTSGLNELVASIDGASAETYALYRKGGSFTEALKNLRLLCDKKKELGGPGPGIVWKFLVFRHNERELEDARRLAEDIGVRIDFQFAVAPGEMGSSLPAYSNDGMREKFIRNYGLPCEQLWRSVTIHADGTVLPCCMVSQMKYSIGNFFREDFRNMWNNQKYRFLRDAVSGRVRADSSLPCSNCMFGGDNKKEQDGAS